MICVSHWCGFSWTRRSKSRRRIYWRCLAVKLFCPIPRARYTWYDALIIIVNVNLICDIFQRSNRHHPMPATPHATPNAWRLNNAYVDVPPSPLDLSQYRALKFCTNALTSYKLKENTPLQQSNLGTAQKNSKLSPLKRKLFHRDHAEETVNVKKSRLSVKGNVKPSLKADSSSKIGNTGPSPDFPDGFTYCHHCNRKRDVHGGYSSK